MKQLFLLCLAISLSKAEFAQYPKISAGPIFSILDVSYEKQSVSGYGGSLRYESVRKNGFSCVFTAGYVSYTKITSPYSTASTKFEMFPIRPGIKYTFQKPDEKNTTGIFTSLELGCMVAKSQIHYDEHYGDYSNKTQTYSNSALSAAFGLGYQFKVVETGVKIYTRNQSDFMSMIYDFHVAYCFALKAKK